MRLQRLLRSLAEPARAAGDYKTAPQTARGGGARLRTTTTFGRSAAQRALLGGRSSSADSIDLVTAGIAGRPLDVEGPSASDEEPETNDAEDDAQLPGWTRRSMQRTNNGQVRLRALSLSVSLDR